MVSRASRRVARNAAAEPATTRGGVVGWLRGLTEALTASEAAVMIATGLLYVVALTRHGTLLATLYGLASAGLCAVDPSLHSVQLLNLAAVVYDLSFELHRLYMLVSNRPGLMSIIMLLALGVEWLLERYEADDLSDGGARSTLGSLARVGRSVGRMLLPAVMGVLIACIGWLVLTAALLHPSAFSAPIVEAVEQMLGARYACAAPSDCIFVTGSVHQLRVHGVYVLSPRQCSGTPPRSLRSNVHATHARVHAHPLTCMARVHGARAQASPSTASAASRASTSTRPRTRTNGTWGPTCATTRRVTSGWSSTPQRRPPPR